MKYFAFHAARVLRLAYSQFVSRYNRRFADKSVQVVFKLRMEASIPASFRIYERCLNECISLLAITTWVGYACHPSSWMRRLKDILRDTPAYQQILEEGLEEGMEKGLQQGLEKGLQQGIEKERQERLQSLRQTIIDLVQARYPKLLKLAKGQTLIIEQPKTLELLLVRVAQAATLEDTQDALLTWEEQ